MTTIAIKHRQLITFGSVYQISDAVKQKAIDQFYANQQDRILLGSSRYAYDTIGKFSLDRASHAVHNLRIDDGQLYGDISILKTGCGTVMKELMELYRTREFSPITFNAFGNGILHKDNTISNYTLLGISWDITPLNATPF